MSSSVTLEMASGQPSICCNRAADGEAPAVAAGERGLVVVVVDVLGDVARLGALELGGGDAVVAHVGEYACRSPASILSRLTPWVGDGVEAEGAAVEPGARNSCRRPTRRASRRRRGACRGGWWRRRRRSSSGDRALRPRRASRSCSSARRSRDGRRRCRRAGPCTRRGARRAAADPAGARARRARPGLAGIWP